MQNHIITAAMEMTMYEDDYESDYEKGYGYR